MFSYPVLSHSLVLLGLWGFLGFHVPLDSLFGLNWLAGLVRCGSCLTGCDLRIVIRMIGSWIFFPLFTFVSP